MQLPQHPLSGAWSSSSLALGFALGEGLQACHGKDQQHHNAARGNERGEVGIPAIILHNASQWHSGIGGTCTVAVYGGQNIVYQCP